MTWGGEAGVDAGLQGGLGGGLDHTESEVTGNRYLEPRDSDGERRTSPTP